MGDTIAAVATPAGYGGVGIVRVSGPRVADIAVAMLEKKPDYRQAQFGPFLGEGGTVLDQGIALLFQGPHSFTGEDVLELQGHGGPVVLDRLLQRVLQLGARLAQAGEFTQRAFLNDKVDLAQAEAISDLIHAQSEAAAQSAVQSMVGVFSDQINMLLEKLIQLRVHVESAIDFPEEEIDFLADQAIIQQAQDIIQLFEALKAQSEQGALLRDGMTLALLGQPNAGKSTLLNALAGEEQAIVTDIPGTTRDTLRADLTLSGVPVTVVDTAGIRESDDIVEKAGIDRAWQAASRADLILVVMDHAQQEDGDCRAFIQRIQSQTRPDMPLCVVWNKVDLTKALPQQSQFDDYPAVYLSAASRDGLDLLQTHLLSAIGFNRAVEGRFLARRRHLDALVRAHGHVVVGLDQLQSLGAGELFAEELRLAQLALSEITGEFSSDDLLGEIFSTFCIGK